MSAAHPSDLLVRPAGAADAELLAAIIRAAFAEYDGRLTPPSGAHRVTAASLLAELADGGALLAERGGAPVGCVLWHRQPGRLYVNRLATLPEARGRGVASALLAAAEALAGELGLARVRLSVRLALAENRASYERRGYRPVSYGTHAGFDAPTFVTLEKRLGDLRRAPPDGLRIRTADPLADESTIAGLWQAALGEAWPLTNELVRRALIGTSHGQRREILLAELGGQPAGFAAVEHDSQKPPGARDGCLVALAVAPELRRRGVGSALHDAALTLLRERGVRTAQLGGGGVRLWPGAPLALPEALGFFTARGWPNHELAFDLLARLDDPAAAHEAPPPDGYAIETLAPARVPELLAFAAAEFPEWLDAYRAIAALGDTDEILIACDRVGTIVAALVIATPRSHPERLDIPWHALLGPGLGGPGVVGVAGALQGRGIGTALVARANQIMRERGVRASLACWTWALSFYGRLGYHVWQTYAMSWRDLAADAPAS